MKVLLALFSVKLRPQSGRFIYLSVHSASLSHIDFCLQILIDESTHTASEADQDNLGKVRSQESDNLSRTHLYVCAARGKLLPTPDGPYFLSEEWNVAAFEAHRANKTQWVTTCANLIEKDIITWWIYLHFLFQFFCFETDLIFAKKKHIFFKKINVHFSHFSFGVLYRIYWTVICSLEGWATCLRSGTLVQGTDLKAPCR